MLTLLGQQLDTDFIKGRTDAAGVTDGFQKAIQAASVNGDRIIGSGQAGGYPIAAQLEGTGCFSLELPANSGGRGTLFAMPTHYVLPDATTLSGGVLYNAGIPAGQCILNLTTESRVRLDGIMLFSNVPTIDGIRVQPPSDDLTCFRFTMRDVDLYGFRVGCTMRNCTAAHIDNLCGYNNLDASYRFEGVGNNPDYRQGGDNEVFGGYFHSGQAQVPRINGIWPAHAHITGTCVRIIGGKYQPVSYNPACPGAAVLMDPDDGNQIEPFLMLGTSVEGCECAVRCVPRGTGTGSQWVIVGNQQWVGTAVLVTNQGQQMTLGGAVIAANMQQTGQRPDGSIGPMNAFDWMRLFSVSDNVVSSFQGVLPFVAFETGERISEFQIHASTNTLPDGVPR